MRETLRSLLVWAIGELTRLQSEKLLINSDSYEVDIAIAKPIVASYMNENTVLKSKRIFLVQLVATPIIA